jgi:uncharacterized membrane protein YeaQ/YmgE (transglycosylase-associated protein family)
MRGVGLLGVVLIGVLAGWIAARTVGRRQSLFSHLLVGVAGAVLGVALVGALGLRPDGPLAGLAVATFGAILLLTAVTLMRRGR